MGKLDGQVALITGGAKGQGRSHARVLAAEGADIALIDNCRVDVPLQPYPGGSREQLEQTRGLVEEQDRRCLSFEADVRDDSAVRVAVETTVAEFGRVDILVCNAGILLTPRRFADIPAEQWRAVIDINLTGVYNCVRAVLPHMVERRYGRIVATSSLAGRTGTPHLGDYTASKWGVIGLIKTVASEYGEFGITANAVCPTNVNSEMCLNQTTYDLFCPDLESPDRASTEARMTMQHPLRIPYIEPEDVSHAIRFLVTDDARYISGEALNVSGGQISMNGV